MSRWAPFILALTLAVVLGACAHAPAQRSQPIAPQHWRLSTGSGVAVMRFPAHGRPQATPIVFLHGGPGAYAVSLRETVDVVSRLSEDGYDVYFYDQVGSGLSDRLADITQYTVQRHVDDLEAVRARIGSERVILLGSSWGATLGAHYSAQYPEHVARLVFVGPGVISPRDWPNGYGRVESRMPEAERERFGQAVEWPPLEAALEILPSDPNAAARALPDTDAGAFFDRITNEFYIPHLGCPGAVLTARSNGYGFWANRMTGRDLNTVPSPAPALRRLTAPALVLRGSCEYIDRRVAEQYRDVLANAALVEIEGAGHQVFWEQPEAFLAAVRAFLRE